MLFFKLLLPTIGSLLYSSKWTHQAPSPNATICNEKNYPNLQVPNHRFADLGHHLPLSCKFEISEKLRECHAQYIETLSASLKSPRCNPESVKKAMCCPFWNSRECMKQAFKDTPVCAPNSDVFYSRVLLNEQEKKHMADHCPEYGPGSKVCKPWEFPISTKKLAMLIVVLVLVIGAIVYYYKKGAPNFNEALQTCRAIFRVANGCRKFVDNLTTD